MKIDNDFNDFLTSGDKAPPKKLDQLLMSKIKADLDPLHSVVFIKLLFIQAFIGFLSLLFCPQFELSLTNNFKLFHFFHHNLGTYWCMAACGTVFIGSGAIVASLILSGRERAKVLSSKGLYSMAITGIALSFFIIFGTRIYLDILSFWALGATISGILSMFSMDLLLRYLAKYTTH
ncbi:MAG: hypothetical protein KAG61_00125 [Bacteriovoracaceae bacterium]|nr:hypothetical protein [Bacteriovoracaceae bacterium]